MLTPFGAFHLHSSTLPAYPGWIRGHVLTKALILSSLYMSLSRFSFLTTFLFPRHFWFITCRPSFFMSSLCSLCLDFPVEQADMCVIDTKPLTFPLLIYRLLNHPETYTTLWPFPVLLTGRTSCQLPLVAIPFPMPSGVPEC